MRTSVQEIFKLGFEHYAMTHRMALRAHKAARAILRCRTDALGAHVQRCPEGHFERLQYHSCRHRSCPKCAALPKARFAERQGARLLGCDHYHVIFTLPHELNELWSHNRAEMTEALFSAVRGTLLALLCDPRHLGATPGLVLALHTWGRTLSRHPHVHALISAGGLSAAGAWKAIESDYLLPVRAVKALYRGKFLARLWARLKHDALRLPAALSREDLERLLHDLATRSWNVRIERRYPHGRGVLRYLARYVKGGPIDNRRLLRADARSVAFRYKDHRDGAQKILRLSTPEFIARILWHVPEAHRHTVRYGGLYAPRARETRERARRALGQSNEAPHAVLDWQRFLSRLGRANHTRCPTCGAALVRGAALAPRRNTISIGTGACGGSVQQIAGADAPTGLRAPPQHDEACDIFLRRGALHS